MEIIKPPIQELKAIGVSIEMEPSLFFDDTALREVPYTLYRLDSSGLRFYYTLDKKFIPTFYVSVTSKNDVVIPKGYGFYKWLASNNEEESEFIKESRACYGSMMHKEQAKLLLNRTYDLGDIEPIAHVHASTNGFDRLKEAWVIELSKDLLSFAQFIRDKNVIPVAVELMLKSDMYGYAGSIDLVCELTFNNKRVMAIIDYKSSKKGAFYESHEVQLKDYMRMWNENFPDKKVEMAFNYSPNNWTKKPTYTLTNQTNACSDTKADYYLGLFKEKQNKESLIPKDVLSVGGIIDISNPLDSLFSIQSAKDFIQDKMEKQHGG